MKVERLATEGRSDLWARNSLGPQSENVRICVKGVGSATYARRNRARYPRFVVPRHDAESPRSRGQAESYFRAKTADIVGLGEKTS